MTCSSLGSLSSVTYEEDCCLDNLQARVDTDLKTFSLESELLDPDTVKEHPLAERLSSCRLTAPSLFADSNMDIFQPPPSTASSADGELSLASSVLEETTEHLHSDLTEICSNETMSVSSYKVWKDDCLLLVWSVSSKSGLELENARLEISPAENFKVR